MYSTRPECVVRELCKKQTSACFVNFMPFPCSSLRQILGSYKWQELGILVNNYKEICPLKLTSMLVNNNIILDLKKYLSHKYSLFI